MDQTACCYVVTTLEIVYALDLNIRVNGSWGMWWLPAGTLTYLIFSFITVFVTSNYPFFSELHVTRIEFPLGPK